LKIIGCLSLSIWLAAYVYVLEVVLNKDKGNSIVNQRDFLYYRVTASPLPTVCRYSISVTQAPVKRGLHAGLCRPREALFIGSCRALRFI